MLASMSVRDLEKQKQWHVTLNPEPEVGSFQQLHLNFYDPLLIEFGSDQLLAVADELGYDGVRFDGHWMIGDVWSGISFGMDGRRPNRGKSLDEINSGNITNMKQYIRASKPDYLFGYNYGNNYESGGARNPNAYRAACQDGGMILWEGAAKTMYIDLRDDSTPDGAGVFQRLTLQYRSSDGFFQIDEFEGTDSLAMTHFSGVLPTPLPTTGGAADYSTVRIRFDYATSQFTVSTIINSVETTIATFSLVTTSGVFDRLRYRFDGQTSGTLPADSAYFVDTATIRSINQSFTVPIATDVVNNVMVIHFDSEPGFDYRLQRAPDLGNWTSKNFTIHGLGQSETVFDPIGFDTHNNYRIICVE